VDATEEIPPRRKPTIIARVEDENFICTLNEKFYSPMNSERVTGLEY
jgi:hypothetical protein